MTNAAVWFVLISFNPHPHVVLQLPMANMKACTEAAVEFEPLVKDMKFGGNLSKPAYATTKCVETGY